MSKANFAKISASPTLPRPSPTEKRGFDVADLFDGPLPLQQGETGEKIDLAEKLRQAYFWIVNTAIISPFYDIEYNDPAVPPQYFNFEQSRVVLPTAQSYSSFVLLPMLTFAVKRRCLLIGGPGRGKTATAILMGIMAGYSLKEIKRAIQHGQPQMTIADLFGNPLPGDLVNAKSTEEIRIAWRKWLGMRIKIIDEYNRIPTRTQSALLTVLADNYAEMYDQVYECPPGAWYLTANDDAGGGTYQVIEALKDRIDVVVKALHFNNRFLGDLLKRIEEDVRIEEEFPQELIFTEGEQNELYRKILKVSVPTGLRRRIEFFASQFEFFEQGAIQLEYKTKDTVKLSGLDLNQAAAGKDRGKDAIKDLGTQTKNGLSVRALMTSLLYIKAMAFIRNQEIAEFEDVRQILPFVLHDKLTLNPQSPFFDIPENTPLRVDRIGWIRRLFDLACAEYDRLGLDRGDPVADIEREFAKGLEGISGEVIKKQLIRIEKILGDLARGKKVYGHLFDDILKLKYFHQRYTNTLTWLKTEGKD